MTCTKKHTNSLEGNYRTLTLEEKKQLGTYPAPSHVYIQGQCGHFLTVKVNGKAKTWKRQPERVQVPYKYGMYEYGYFTEKDEVRVSA